MKNAFTLIELLVVIAIIGLLASVVLVSMSGLQGKARITKTLEFSQSLQRNLGAYAVGIWSFDDQTNPTKDGSGYNNNGTITGATFTSDTPHSAAGVGSGKYALIFNGANNWIKVNDSNSLDTTSAITIEAWVKRAATGANHQILIKNGPYNFRIRSDDKLGMQIYDGTSWGTEAVGATAISANTWYHVIGTFDGSNLKLYVNGVLDKIMARTGTMDTETSPLWIGANSTGQADPTSAFFNGIIDELRIYEKALTLGEVQRHYADGTEYHKNLAAK